MGPIDIAIIVIALIGITLFGSLFSRRASSDTDHFIVGGRNMPFWLAALSLVASNLNASTPLSDSRKIRNDGIAGQWFAWTALINSSVSTIWFIRLWRRSAVTTAIEFYDLRYASRAGAFARVWNVVVIGCMNGTLWGAVGLVGMKKLTGAIFDLPVTTTVLGMALPTDWLVVIGVVALALTYSATAGVYGVVWTDLVELVVILICSFTLTILVYRDVGWNTGLHEKIMALGDEGHRLLTLAPEFGPAAVVLLVIQPLFSLGMYNPGVQRMLCVKDERETLRSFCFGTLVSYILRPWPFLLAGLAGMFLVSDTFLLEHFPPLIAPNGEPIPDYEMVYPTLIAQYLPTGLLGLMMVAFLFAFMSSYDTGVHTHGSMFTNDLYRPFLVRNKSPRHYVNVARVFMVVQTILSIFIAVSFDNILGMIIVALMVHNAAGGIPFLRFIWWRVNGKSEVAALVTGLAMVWVAFSPVGDQAANAVAQFLHQETNDAFYAIRYLMITLTSTGAGLLVILLTKPEPMDKLMDFYKRVRPYGAWGPVAAACPEYRHHDPIPLLIGMTVLGITYGFGGIFAAVGLLLAMWPLCLISTAVCLLSLWGYLRGINRLYPGGEIQDHTTALPAKPSGP